MTELKRLGLQQHKKHSFPAFIEAANLDIQHINKKIIEFNRSEVDEKKIDILNQIYTLREEMNNKYPLNYIADCKDYQEQIHRDLWLSLKEQFDVLGVASLHDRRLPKSGFTANPSSAVEIFSNMPLLELEKFISVCWNFPLHLKAALLQIYSEDSPGKNNFLKFLETHRLTVLSSDGNSRNIKIEKFPADGSLPVTLKIDARLNKPKEAELFLRRRGFAHFTKRLSEERQWTIQKSDQSVMAATLFLNDFCPGGNLLSKSSRLHETFTAKSEIVLSALDYYQQMALILIEMQQIGCVFPDAKNTNWLIDAENKLKISDTKSLLFIAADGNLLFGDKNNQWIGGIATSQFIRPKEILSFGHLSAISADKLHSFALGKNLYQYLTHCSYRVLDEAVDDNFSKASGGSELSINNVSNKSKNDSSVSRSSLRNSSFKSSGGVLVDDLPDADLSVSHSSKKWSDKAKFTDEIFRTVGGRALQELIKKMVLPEPQERCSLSQALEELKRINNWYILQKECSELCHELLAHSPEEDIILKSRIVAIQNQLLSGQDEISELEQLKKDLGNQSKLINQAHHLPGVFQLIFRQTALNERDIFIQKMNESDSSLREPFSASSETISYLVQLEKNGELQLMIRGLWKQHKEDEKSNCCFSSEAEHTYREIQKQDKKLAATAEIKLQEKLSLIYKYVTKKDNAEDVFAKLLLNFFSKDLLNLNNNRKIKKFLVDMKSSSEPTTEKTIVNRGKP